MLNADPREERIRFIQNAIELALTIGDFQKEVDSACTPETAVKEALKRIERLIDFDCSAIYLVEEPSSDLQLCAYTPMDAKGFLEDELAFMIDHGFVAWAMREGRGIRLNSKDGSRRVLLHVMATYSRIRGLFIGIFPPHASKLQDASLEMVSIILRNASNSIESLIYSSEMRDYQNQLEKEMELKTRQLVHYEKQLAAAQNMETIATLAGGVAHQFNNALQTLMGNIELISMTAHGETKIMEHIARTRLPIDRMVNLTSQLTAYARGGTFVAKQTVAVQALVNEILPAVKRSIKPTIELRVALDETSATVDVDLLQFRTVVLAVVVNADEAIADQGFIEISSQLLGWEEIPEDGRQELTQGAHVCIGLQDNGQGMDNDTLRRLFEPFYSTKFAGRGLSMAAVSGIIKRHNGWIQVNSELGQGTRVNLYLPVSLSAASQGSP